jgi:hypothetical protein
LKPAIVNLCGHPATPDGESRDRVLVNFFYAPPVGHAVEALHYCLGHHLAHPEREISVVLNAASAVELAGFCPFVSEAFAVDHPLLEPCPDSAARQAAIPRRWDWVLDDHRRHQQLQLELFPGLRDYYLTSDRLLTATHGRTVVGATPPGYVAHRQLRLELPEAARAAASRRFDERSEPSGAGRIAVMPAGSGDRVLYPSAGSWRVILDALVDAFPGVQIALVGKRARDGRTATAFTESEIVDLLAHRSRPLDCFDVPLPEQLAVVEACDVFLAPHTGFGMAALAVGTPWLALSGGRWFEFFFNRVPFRSIIPDERYPSFTQFALAPVVQDSDGEPRTLSMTRARIEQDLDRIVAAARELLAGSVTYEQCLRDYFPALVAAQGGDAGAIWSIDGVHLAYV